MATLSRGDVVLTQFPFTDLSGAAMRPCLIVSAGLIGQDLIVSAISSVLRSGAISTDVLIDLSHAEFQDTGLKVSSVIRVHKLVAIDQSIIKRRLGRLGPQLQSEVDKRLMAVLGLSHLQLDV